MSSLWTHDLVCKGFGLQGDKMCNEQGIKTSINTMDITNAETCIPVMSIFLNGSEQNSHGNLCVSNMDYG